MFGLGKKWLAKQNILNDSNFVVKIDAHAYRSAWDNTSRAVILAGLWNVGHEPSLSTLSMLS